MKGDKGELRINKNSRLSLFIGCTFLLLGNVALASNSPPIHVAVEGKRVSATLNNASLDQVLAALGKPLGFTAHIDPALTANSITETFQDVPTDLVLDRLLRGMNYALAGSSLYVWPRDAKSSSPGSNPEEWTVVASEEPAQEEPISVEQLKVEFELAPDPEARLAALEDLLTHSWEEGEEAMVPTLVTALQDQEPEVRTLALEGLYGIENSEAQDAVHDAVIRMAEADPLPEHRVQALVWLTERNPQEARVLLENTLGDTDPDIRAFAAGLLEEFEAFTAEETE